MGEFISKSKLDIPEFKAFTKALINDIDALESMLEKDLFENDITRIGAEQELCIVDELNQPFPISLDLLKAIDDPHYTHELAKFNIEINLDPLELKGNCFSEMEIRLQSFMEKAHKKAAALGGRIILAGILPTIGKREVKDNYITPIPRYYALNEALKKHKGSDFSLKIRGVDEVALYHNSVMFEACNTSFQLHLQIPSFDFISSYNWAQAIAGPVLSACCNSPMLMGRELWQETRIALFQQSLDTRKTSYALKDQMPRVGFGTNWEKGSVAEIYKNDVSKHRILLTKPIEKEATQILKNGEIPKLEALSLHNGTVYRWNRPCYGIGNGKPHLRIENRYIPSGPSIKDEMANFALWIGLMKGRPEEYNHLPDKMDFREVKNNFIKAARYGKETVMIWHGKEVLAADLMKNTLLPIARKGLESCGIHNSEIEEYLGIIELRLKGQTGAQWQIRNFRRLVPKFKVDQSLNILTGYLHLNERKGLPVYRWPMISEDIESEGHLKVKEIMSTQLLSLHEDDMAEMALAIMQWNNIHHIPVVNDQGKLTGLLTWSYMENLKNELKLDHKKVGEIMVKEIITASPDMEIKTAKEQMEKHGIGCLPIISDDTVIGILSKTDL